MAKFFAKFSGACWICARLLHRSWSNFQFVNKKIGDGNASRPALCYLCQKKMWAIESPIVVKEAA
jgi:hypothetical protein